MNRSSGGVILLADNIKLFPYECGFICLHAVGRNINRDGFFYPAKHTILASRWHICIASYAPETGAILECLIFNAGDAVGDSHTRQTRAPRESTTSNAGDAIGNNSIFAPIYEFVSGSFNYCIAIIATIIYGISVFNNNTTETSAIPKSINSNAGDAATDRQTTETGAIQESLISNSGDAVRNRHTLETGALIESITSNAGDAVNNRHTRNILPIRKPWGK